MPVSTDVALLLVCMVAPISSGFVVCQPSHRSPCFHGDTYPIARAQRITMTASKTESFFQEEKKDGESPPLLIDILDELPSFPSEPDKKMLVLDKDGTLGDDSASLRRWADHMTKRLREALLEFQEEPSTQDVIEKYHAALGWDALRQTVVPSAPLAAGTWQDQVDTTATFCSMYLSSSSDVRALAQSWHDELGSLHGQDAPLVGNLPELLQTCRDMGWIVAICTSDDRAPTDTAMQNWKIDDVVQYSVCGNEVSEGKPSAVPLQVLCQQTGVLPSQCVVVGDTSADSGMAYNAQAGFCIGVLTGSGTAEQLLATGAQWVVPHVGHLPEILSQFSDAHDSDDG